MELADENDRELQGSGNNQGVALEAGEMGVRVGGGSEISVCLYGEQADAELLGRGGGGRGRNWSSRAGIGLRGLVGRAGQPSL